MRQPRVSNQQLNIKVFEDGFLLAKDILRLTKNAGIIINTAHLVHHLSTTLATAACFGSTQRSFEVLVHLLITPSSSSELSTSLSPSPNLSLLPPNKLPYPLPKPRPELRFGSKLFLLPLRCVSGTARKRPRRGELSLVAPRGSLPCWKLKNEGIPGECCSFPWRCPCGAFHGIYIVVVTCNIKRMKWVEIMREGSRINPGKGIALPPGTLTK